MSKFLFSIFPNENFIDLTLYQYGWEQCDPSHSFGPAARNHFLFHYILSGTGVLNANNEKGITKSYQVKSGQGFMIFPHQICTYIADQNLPWEYVWLEFDGLRAKELVDMVRTYQPDVVIDNRLEGAGDNHGSIATRHPLSYSGDFASPEQIIPPQGICDEDGTPIPWELCATMNNHWGYCNFDRQYKSPQMLIRKLVECVSKGGNMILNVGPDAKGNIPSESVAILEEIGRWMEKNKESIYGCGISDLPKPEWGRYTQNKKTIYAHVYETPLGALPLYGIAPDAPASITYLADGTEVRRGEAWNTALYHDMAFISFGEDPVFTYPLPDEHDTVLKIQLKEKEEVV